MLTYFAGIDPGKTGALAVIDEKRNVVHLCDAPTEKVKKGRHKKTRYAEAEFENIFNQLDQFEQINGDMSVTIENVHAMPRQGVSTTFTLGVGFGLWVGACAARGYVVARVEPRIWKNVLKLKKGASKKASLTLARKLFPRAELHLQKHDGRAEALLIAEYARRTSLSSRQ